MAIAPTGWRRNLTLFLLGVLATLALPPVFMVPLLIPAFVGLYWLTANSPTRRRAFWDGWWWGWGFYISGLYWFAVALLTDPDKFAWLIPFATLGLTGIIAIYAGAACWLFAWTKQRGIGGIFCFSVIWTLVEFARGHLFTGFPWNLAGYSFATADAPLQLASLVGAYGLTWLAVWLGTVPAALAEPSVSRRRAWATIALSYMALAIGIGWGEWRLHQADYAGFSAGTQKSRPVLRLVQANIAQHHKWDPKLQMKGLREHIRLMRSPGMEKITHFIWPETAVPFVVQADSSLTRLLGQAVPPGKLLITGAMREEGKEESWRIWNSLLAIGHGGGIVGTYDKSRLVPFGEFLPLRSLLPDNWLTPVGAVDFSGGAGPQTMRLPDLPPFSPLICYEAIFPEQAVKPGDRPDFLLNVTNDAWFGFSFGPYQHFHMARMRAVEQGLPMVRVANTGISAAIDSYGRTQYRLGLGEKGVVDFRLQKPQPSATVFFRYGNSLLGLLAALMLVKLIWRKLTYFACKL